MYVEGKRKLFLYDRIEAITNVMIKTPPQPVGPFYPVEFPLDLNNDLATIEGRSGQAQGQIIRIVGRVLNELGEPVANSRIEIWQTNGFGRYHNVNHDVDLPLDPNFQGYGYTVTGIDGIYRFRTVRPLSYRVNYGWRAPHIHFIISTPGFERLVTQMYFAGEELNEQDLNLNQVSDPEARNSLIITLQPADELEPGAMMGTFDIVLTQGGRYSGSS